MATHRAPLGGGAIFCAVSARHTRRHVPGAKTAPQGEALGSWRRQRASHPMGGGRKRGGGVGGLTGAVCRACAAKMAVGIPESGDRALARMAKAAADELFELSVFLEHILYKHLLKMSFLRLRRALEIFSRRVFELEGRRRSK